jgi:acyl-CoA synthetase (AMP-forming)/AMP-acid ligase II
MDSKIGGTTGGIGSWATRRALLCGDRIALIDGDLRITYAEFDRRTDQLARALRELGVRQGDRVAALLVNSAAFLETMFATAKLGALFVPINFRLTAPEVTYLLADSGADVFVWSGHLSDIARAALAGGGVRVRARVVVGGEPADGEADFEEVLASGEPRALGIPVAGSDLSCLMYTSGTTGRPKGAMLTHDNHLWNAINTLIGHGLREHDRTLTVMSLFHIGGLGSHTLPLLYLGGTVALLPAFDPENTLATMARERVTVQILVPAMWAALTTVPDFDSTTCRRSSWPSPVVHRARAGARIPGKGCALQGFGMTETAPAVTILDADHVKEKNALDRTALFHVRLASSTRTTATYQSAM